MTKTKTPSLLQPYCSCGAPMHAHSNDGSSCLFTLCGRFDPATPVDGRLVTRLRFAFAQPSSRQRQRELDQLRADREAKIA